MAVPKKKVSKARRDSRKANFKASAATLTECKQCHTPIVPHRVCKNCGNYKGAKRLETKTDKKKEKKKDA